MKLSIRQLFVAILFVSLFVMTTRPVLDADFWWHLRTGQWIVENRTIPHADPFSHTFGGKAWTAHEWLSEVIFYGIYRLGGLALLALTFSAIITAAYALAFRRSAGQPYIAGFATVLAALASAPIWGVRPQMFTLLLFSIYLYLLEQYFNTAKLRFLLPLPFLMVLWVNLHAGYALGLFVMGMFIAAKGLESLLPEGWSGDNGIKLTRSMILPVGGVLAATVAAVLFNPNGAYMFVYPFETLGSNAMMTMIQEWFSPDFHAREWLPLAALIMGVLAAGMFSRRRSSITEILLTGILGYAALRSMRNAPLFAVGVIPVLAHHLDGILPITVNKSKPTKIINIANFVILGFVALVGIAQITSTLLSQAESEKEYFPVESVAWIKENAPPGKIFNTYGWGGYIIWHLPEYPVYIDGRADVYGDAFMRDFMSIYNAQPGWAEKLETAGVNLVLVETGSPIADALAGDEGWELTQKDESSVLFERK